MATRKEFEWWNLKFLRFVSNHPVWWWCWSSDTIWGKTSGCLIFTSKNVTLLNTMHGNLIFGTWAFNGVSRLNYSVLLVTFLLGTIIECMIKCVFFVWNVACFLLFLVFPTCRPFDWLPWYILLPLPPLECKHSSAPKSLHWNGSFLFLE